MLNVVTLRGLVGQPRNFIHFQVNNIFSKDFSKKIKNKNGNGFILSKSTIIISFFWRSLGLIMFIVVKLWSETYIT